MPIHYNSIKSIKQLKKGGKHNRILQIYHITNRPMTDREVKIIGKFEDMNEVRPRITELINDYERLEECGNVHCVVTKKEVRLTRLVLQRELF